MDKLLQKSSFRKRTRARAGTAGGAPETRGSDSLTGPLSPTPHLPPEIIYVGHLTF